MIRTGGIASRPAVAFVLGIVLVSAVGYAVLTYEAAQSNYSFTFSISVVYSGNWQVTYYGFRNVVGIPSDSFSGSRNYTGGVFAGGGSGTKAVVLSGPNNGGLTLCVVAQKLDASNNMIGLGLGSRLNTTSAPNGKVSLCLGVVP